MFTHNDPTVAAAAAASAHHATRKATRAASEISWLPSGREMKTIIPPVQSASRTTCGATGMVPHH